MKLTKPFSLQPLSVFYHPPISMEFQSGQARWGRLLNNCDQWSLNVGLDIVQQIRDYAKEVENWQQSNAPSPYQFKIK